MTNTKEIIFSLKGINLQAVCVQEFWEFFVSPGSKYNDDREKEQHCKLGSGACVVGFLYLDDQGLIKKDKTGVYEQYYSHSLSPDLKTMEIYENGVGKIATIKVLS